MDSRGCSSSTLIRRRSVRWSRDGISGLFRVSETPCTPILVDGRLYVRLRDRLACYHLRARNAVAERAHVDVFGTGRKLRPTPPKAPPKGAPAWSKPAAPKAPSLDDLMDDVLDL